VKLTLLEMLEATGGGEIGGTQVGNTFTTYHTDSREVVEGGVFFALKGAGTDGHRFIADALSRGAAALVVQSRTEIAHGVVEILVPDTWVAFYSLARHVLTKVKPVVVGITGSNGKTSTKEMVAAVLAQKHQVLRTTGNLNTETGVPLTILKLEPAHTALVLEMGLQHAGDIARLAELARPSIGVITNIGTVHMEFFASQEDLARAKGELVAALPGDGLAVLNADDPFLPLLQGLTQARVVTFGMNGGDYQGERYRNIPDGGAGFSVKGVYVHLGVSGKHQMANALAALAVGEHLGVPLSDGADALRDVAVEHRMHDVHTAGGVTIVDDAYNASPESMLAAFETIAERPRRGRLFAVLGQMSELGSAAEAAHRKIGEHAAATFDAVAVIDTALGRILAEAAGGHVLPDREAAVVWVKNHARRGDVVLVKASHGIHLDEVVRELAP